MSAFYDIWIGNEAPEYGRTKTSQWRKANENTWLCIPHPDKGFLQQHTSGNYRLILIGQLYEPVSPEDLLKRCKAYIQGKKDYHDVAGHYIVFVTDDKKGDTYVFTNRFGTYHAYWSVEQKISTCYLALVKQQHQKVLDWEAITGFMAMGYFPNDNTYLKGVKIFEPASFYHFDSTLTLVEKKRYRYWQYKKSRHKEAHFTEQLHKLIKESLQYSVKDKRTAIPISGGLDSRMLTGELANINEWKELNGLSYGYTDNSPELKIAKQVAQKKNIPLHTYVMPDYLFDKLDNITESVELFQYVDGTRQASAVDWLNENADVVVGGHWGDVWLDSMNVHSKDDLHDAFNKKIVKRGSAWLLDNVCKQYIARPEDFLNDYFSSFLNMHVEIKDADFKMKIYKTDQWSFRWTTASLRMYQAAAMPVLPFYDCRVADMFSAVPVEILQDRQLQINYLKKYHEDLARITWQEYDADLYNYKYFNNRNLAYRAVKKVQRTLSKEKTIQRNWEVFFLNPSGRKNLESHLLDNDVLHNIVSRNKVKELLDDLHHNPNASNGYTVSMLLTFATFLKQVFS